MHKNATKCNKTQSKWCINKRGALKIIDTFETYQPPVVTPFTSPRLTSSTRRSPCCSRTPPASRRTATGSKSGGRRWPDVQSDRLNRWLGGARASRGGASAGEREAGRTSSDATSLGSPLESMVGCCLSVLELHD
jgi:hypothetical protein